MTDPLLDLLEASDEGVVKYHSILAALRQSSQQQQSIISENLAAASESTKLREAAVTESTFNDYLRSYRDTHIEGHRRYLAEWGKTLLNAGERNVNEFREDENGELERGDEESLGVG